jgi:O-antigen/teichoic acid export membrane protein
MNEFPKNNLKKDYLWNSIGTSVNAFISLLLLIVVTRINGLDDAGLFSFSFGFAIVFYTIGLYGGRVYQISDVRNEFSSANYIILKFMTSALMLFAASAAIMANAYDARKSLLILLLVFYKMSEAIADALYGVIQKHNRLFIAGISLTCKGCLGFAAFLIVDLITENLLLASACLPVVNILFTISYDRVNANISERISLFVGSFKAATANSLLLMKKCLYIFAFSFLTTTMVNIPRYFIDIYHESDQGYFGILIMPATLVALFVSFIIQPEIVPLSQLHKNGRYDLFAKAVRRILFVSLALGAVAIAGTYLIGSQIMTLIYGVDLTGYRIELTEVVIGGTLNVIAAVYSNVLVVIRKQFVQLIIYLLSLGVVTAMCAAFAAEYSIAGGIWASVVANAVQGALFVAAYHVILKKR